jgi:hypothetical protein
MVLVLRQNLKGPFTVVAARTKDTGKMVEAKAEPDNASKVRLLIMVNDLYKNQDN